jgi:TonB-linked SusC/RagA family outer membrane protein
MQNNLEYRGMLRLCLIFLFSFFPPPYLAHFPHGHGFEVSTLLLNQQQQISGTVTDSYGPMPGVHVLIKGTHTGTFTDQEGQYSLLVNNGDTLVFSYLGHHTRELPVLGRTTLDVELQSEVTELQEVEINAGYYTVKERERTGSIARVTAKEIELQPIVSPLEALQGRMAGVEVVQRSGIPGSAPTIRIRGQNSLRAEGNFPLYIIDGVPVNATPINSYGNMSNTGIDPLNTLNLANIESIEVLKDGDATAIYGSRGANGVVLITTKKGTQRKTEIEARWYSGIGKASNKMELLNTEEYLRIRKRAFENDGAVPTESNAYDLLLWDQDRYTDWQDQFFGGTSHISDINISASGGNANTAFRIGGSYHREGTVLPGDFGYDKITAGFNIHHTSENNRLTLNLSLNYGADSNNFLNNLSLVSNALNIPPNAPDIFNGDGTLNWEDWEYSAWNNPMAGFYNTSKARSNNIISGTELSYHFTDGLLFRTNLGYTDLVSSEVIKMPIRSYNPDSWERVSHRSIHSRNNRKSWILEPQLVYNGELGKGRLDALMGLTFQQSEDYRILTNANGYVSESLIGNLGAAENITVNSNEEILYRYHALFARIGYNWKERYFLNLTARRDGSSRFGADRRFANFGAVGGAWIFSTEPFIKNSFPFLSFGKLRGSYGITGSDQIGDYGYMDAYGPTRAPGGLYPTQLTNPDFSWEENRKLEAALDLGFMDDRLNLGAGWYRNRSSNQLVGYPLPSVTGFATVQANLPATVQNTGWELELASHNIRSKDLDWRTFLNLSIPNNKLLAFPDMDQTSYANRYRVGHPLNIRLLYQYDGLDPETGFYRMVDVDQDGRLDYTDRTVIQDQGREYFIGINNSIQYKGLSLEFLWEYVEQEGYRQPFSPGFINNYEVGALDALEEGSPLQKVSQSIDAYIAYSRVVNSDFSRENASFLRLKTVSLSYDLPVPVLQTVGINAGKLILGAQNLITLTDYKGLDPQSLGNNLPVLRTITCGLQLNF